MKANVGGIDRILRALVGIALILWAAVLGGPAWAYIGAIPLFTALLGWCPAYVLFGMSTCPAKKG